MRDDREQPTVSLSKYFLGVFVFFCLWILSSVALADSSSNQVEINGDAVEYSHDGQTIIARGNVEVLYQGLRLLCDRVEFERNSKIAYAQGDVRLISDQAEIFGREMSFNFDTMEGDLNGAKLVSHPFYGTGHSVKRVSEEKFVLSGGFITTSDFDKPEHRITSKRIEIYPKEKVVARHVTVRLGDVPIFYLPKYTQRLDDDRPNVSVRVGREKDFGAYIYTGWRYYLNKYLKGTIHLDYREKKDFASGIDVEYTSDNFGEGLLRTYYMNERTIDANRIWQDRETPTIERERFLAEWRHFWQMDDKTTAIGQYYKVSDSTFLKDYFEDYYDEDITPRTYFLMSRVLPKGNLSLRTDIRTNRFDSTVERLPEIKYDLPNTELLDSGFYLKSATTYSNLNQKPASPSDTRLGTTRVHTDNQISYPFKLAFLELTPFIGGSNTYYSKTLDRNKYDAVRGVFRTGGSVKTDFYKMMETQIDSFLLKIDQLRHIITPGMDYLYQHEPTVDNADLDQFDLIDDQNNEHKFVLSLENKLQTKRNGNTADLLRSKVSIPYFLKEDDRRQGFSTMSFETDFYPVDWLTIRSEAEYQTRLDRLLSADLDVLLRPGDKWSYSIGAQYDRNANDLITSTFEWNINPKWAMRIYERFDVQEGEWEEQGYGLIRDLHSWDLEFNVNSERKRGTEITFMFRLKAFPDVGFNFDRTYDKPKSNVFGASR